MFRVIVLQIEKPVRGHRSGIRADKDFKISSQPSSYRFLEFDDYISGGANSICFLLGLDYEKLGFQVFFVYASMS